MRGIGKHSFRPRTSAWDPGYSGVGHEGHYSGRVERKARRAGRKDERITRLEEKGKGGGKRAERLARRSAALRKRSAEIEAKKKLKGGDALGPGILSSLPGGQPTPFVQNGFDIASEEDVEYALNGKPQVNPLAILAGLGVLGGIGFWMWRRRS